MFKGDSLPDVSDTAFYAKYGTVLQKKNDFKLFYGGDDFVVAREAGRDACTMTGADVYNECIRDDKLQFSGSGNTCGHKYYNTDQGQGTGLLSNYSNQFWCNDFRNPI